MLLTAAALAARFEARHAQPGTFDLQASGTAPDVNFGKSEPSETISGIQAAAGVLSFNGAGKTRNAKALSHFLVLGETVRGPIGDKPGDIVELPEADFKRMEANGQVVEATDEDIAAAQKATKGK